MVKHVAPVAFKKGDKVRVIWTDGSPETATKAIRSEDPAPEKKKSRIQFSKIR